MPGCQGCRVHGLPRPFPLLGAPASWHSYFPPRRGHRYAVENVMKDAKFIVRKAAVLGAGVMGAQIAAHLVNANVETLLFELPAKDGDPNANVTKAIDNLAKLDPSPLSVPGRATYIQPANYEQHLALLAECDLVIEAIAERMDWKHDL